MKKTGFVFRHIFLILLIMGLNIFLTAHETSAGNEQGYVFDKAGGSNAGFRNIRELPFLAGEKLVYQVRYKGVKIGTSFLTFKGEKKLNGQDVYLVEFFTDTIYLKDEERIFAHKENFLPLRVERIIRRTPGFTTKIVEDYDQRDYKINITKRGFIGRNRFTIDKDSNIHNAILISYYFRLLENIKETENFLVNLPTKEFFLDYKGKENVQTGLGSKQALRFEGRPYAFNFWLSADESRVPLKIKDPGMFGYSLVLDRK
jgi:hypothetical protein